MFRTVVELCAGADRANTAPSNSPGSYIGPPYKNNSPLEGTLFKLSPRATTSLLDPALIPIVVLISNHTIPVVSDKISLQAH
jgi:hypothetical protein